MTLLNKCPICSTVGAYSLRYPKYVCSECEKRAADANGRALMFLNESISGGFLARYMDTGESYPSHVCYIDGVMCWADEAYLGGIVIRLYDASFEN